MFGALNIEDAIEPQAMEVFAQKKAALKDDVETLQAKVTQLKASRKALDRHIAIKDLPEEQRFKQLSTHSKHFVDAIKMVAYRAETAMANFLRETLTRNTVQWSMVIASANGLLGCGNDRCTALFLGHLLIFTLMTRGLIRLRREGSTSSEISCTSLRYQSSRAF